MKEQMKIVVLRIPVVGEGTGPSSNVITTTGNVRPTVSDADTAPLAVCSSGNKETFTSTTALYLERGEELHWITAKKLYNNNIHTGGAHSVQ